MRIRLKFIEAMLLTEQRLTLQIIANRFEVALPTAGRDMRAYRSLASVKQVGRGESSTYVLDSEPAYQWEECPTIFLKHLEKVYEHTDKRVNDPS